MSACLLLILPSLVFGAVFGSLWERWIYTRMLVSKARPEGRTPEHIDGGFYYIVPESEYVEMLIARQRDDDCKRADGP